MLVSMHVPGSYALWNSQEIGIERRNDGCYFLNHFCRLGDYNGNCRGIAQLQESLKKAKEEIELEQVQRNHD